MGVTDGGGKVNDDMFGQKQEERSNKKPLYGVNLGGWLLLEKWMTPSLFAGTAAADEFNLMLTKNVDIHDRLKRHRDTFITAADFAWLQLHGVRAVRLPVGYWVFGGEEPYSGCIEYVDKAFQWAEETGIKILLDMHGAAGSQNGLQESGRIGKIGWHKNQKYIIQTLEIMKKLAERYAGRSALLGIELLNEPNSKIPRRILLGYYQAAYRMIRGICGEEPWVVFSDNFKPRRWKRKLRGPGYINCYIDTHQYQTYTARDQKLDITGHFKKTLGKISRQLHAMQRDHPVIVGEWSLVLSDRSLQNLNARQRTAALRAYGDAQLIAFENVTAWFYWSYKTESSSVWNFKEMTETGLLPNLTAM